MATQLSELKYNKDYYIDSGFFDGDMDNSYIRENESLVKCRKAHECVGAMDSCVKMIQPKEYAVRVTTLFPGEGFKTCYVCTNCIEEWLEESGQIPMSEDF